ncbi:MAG TPA: suppressor of fused domain protein [Longimicrobium sp.]|jgi:hypothetical protein
MTDNTPTLEKLHAAVEEWIGVPDHVVELRHEGADEGLLRELDVAFLLPTDNPRDDDITTAMTVGLGLHTLPQLDPRVELVLEIKGKLSEEEQTRVAHDLGKMIIERLRKGLYLDPGTLVPAVIHPFASMPYLLLKHWTTTPTHLPFLEPNVLILRAIPLYESETKVVEEVGDLAANRLKGKGAVFEDYERPAAA